MAALLRRPEVQAARRANPAKYDDKSAQGRMNILRDLSDTKVDNLLELAIIESENQGGDRGLVDLRALVHDFTGSKPTTATSAALNTFSAGMHNLGYLLLLPRVAWSSLAEPTAVMLRTGNLPAAVKTFKVYAREAVRSAKSTQELAALGRAVGIVSTQLHDSVMMNRLGGDFDRAMSENVFMTNFFRANFLSQLTNAQNRAAMAGGTYWIRELFKGIDTASAEDPAQVAILRAELNDLGVVGKDQDTLRDWFETIGELPGLGDLNSKGGPNLRGRRGELRG